MSEVVVGLLGFACIVAIVVTLFKSKTLPSIAFIIFPMILGVILVFGGYYSWENIGKLIKSGFSSTGPTAALFVFSVLYFGIMTDAGMFDVIIGKLMLLVKDNVIGVCVMTCIIALIGHLDGGGASTFCIVVPAMLPVYKKMHMRPTTLLRISVIAMGVLNLMQWAGPTMRAATVLGIEAGAVDTYTAIIDYDKKAADAYYLRGCVYLKQGDTESAVSDFDKAVKNNSSDYELYVNIYENLSAYDMTEKGEEYLNKAFDIKGNSAGDYAWRGRIYYYLGQYDNAQTELKSALDKESVIANLYIAQVYEAQGDTENAEVYYQNYVNTGSADSQAMNALGEIEMAKGNYSGALTYLEQGIAMENVTNRRELMQNLIICYEYTSDFNSAWNVVQEYVQVYPDDASAQREYIFLKNRMEQTAPVENTEEAVTEDTQTVEDTQTPEEAQTPAQ